MNFPGKIAATVLAVAAVAGGATAAQARVESGSDNLPSATRAAAPDVVPAPLSATRFAVVDFDGDLVRGRNVISAAPLANSPGRYEVTFDRDVRNCAYTATIADQGASDEISGLIDLAQRNGKPNAVFVETSTLGDVPDLRDFHLVVSC